MTPEEIAWHVKWLNTDPEIRFWFQMWWLTWGAIGHAIANPATDAYLSS